MKAKYLYYISAVFFKPKIVSFLFNELWNYESCKTSTQHKVSQLGQKGRMCLPLTLIVYRHCIDFLFFCIIVFFFSKTGFSRCVVCQSHLPYTLLRVLSPVSLSVLSLFPQASVLHEYFFMTTHEKTGCFNWMRRFLSPFLKKISRNNLKINNNYHYYAYENWKKKRQRGQWC